MKRLLAVLSALVTVVAALVWATPAVAQAPVVLVDDTTLGQYNAALGTALDATQPQFPCADSQCGDPTIDPAPEPDLSSVSSILGGWLSNPPSLSANWSGPQVIPFSWDLNTETAIVYEIKAGSCGARNVTGSFGVDNGIFVWVNGAYKFGALAPGGGAVAGEYVVDLGNLPPGVNFVQILREDHGSANGYAVELTGIVGCPADDDDDEDDGDDDGDDGEDDGDDDDDGEDDGDDDGDDDDEERDNG
jgi:hypothetical protein